MSLLVPRSLAFPFRKPIVFQLGSGVEVALGPTLSGACLKAAPAMIQKAQPTCSAIHSVIIFGSVAYFAVARWPSGPAFVVLLIPGPIS